jgi:hypothetical protein
MIKRQAKKKEKFTPSIPEEVRSSPEFQKEIRRFIKASLSVYKLE